MPIEKNKDNTLLDRIRQKDALAWQQLVDIYQGRLLAYASNRCKSNIDAEDMVQQVFTLFLRAIEQFRGTSLISLETYLYVILRNVISNHYRTRWSRSVCLLEDISRTNDDVESGDPIQIIEGDSPSASYFVVASEQKDKLKQALAQALDKMINSIKKKQKFRDLKVCELLFCSALSNRNIVELVQIDNNSLRVIKHRYLKRLQEELTSLTIDMAMIEQADQLLKEIWESGRLSCPKRSTLVRFWQDDLEIEWFDYIDFHLTVYGCHFCRASVKDIQNQDSQTNTHFSKQIVTSTIGFFNGLNH